MKRKILILIGLLCVLSFSMAALAGDVVSPEEVVLKVKEAAAYLEEAGEEGLAEFKDPEGPWAWENTYVFVYDCAEGVCVANIFPDVVGKSIEDILDDEGWPVGVELCKAGMNIPKAAGSSICGARRAPASQRRRFLISIRSRGRCTPSAPACTIRKG